MWKANLGFTNENHSQKSYLFMTFQMSQNETYKHLMWEANLSLTNKTTPKEVIPTLLRQIGLHQRKPRKIKCPTKSQAFPHCIAKRKKLKRNQVSNTFV